MNIHRTEHIFAQHPLFRNDDIEDELRDLFTKKYTFEKNNDWKLPDKELWFTTSARKLNSLESLKAKLNFHKSQLNDFSIEEWSSHTRRRNPAGEVVWKLRCLINPEFLTQAWTKFYECVCTYNLIPVEAVASKDMVSLHLCEAPGAFITSLNHFLKLNHQNIQWKWMANTLNPYYEGNSPSNMVSDDRFMFHTLDNWDFGVDNTGNLMNWQNSQAIINKVKGLGKVMLVTADGSIDCLQRPDAQEEVTSLLHYCEIITALQALSPGGTLVFKLFTMFEHCTVSLLYLINHVFEEVHIYKPVTSRQGNSEVYAICLRFRDNIDLDIFIPILKNSYGTELYSQKALFPLETIPESFLKQIEECATYFCSIQCKVINSNLQAYIMQKNVALHRNIKKMRSAVASEYIWRYNLGPIEYEQEILKGLLHEENKLNTNPRYHRGSYTERQMYSKMSLKEKSKSLSAFLQAELLSNPLTLINEPVKWMHGDINLKLKTVFTYGCPLQKIISSKFILVPIFKVYQQILSEAEFYEILLYKESKLQVNTVKDTENDNPKVLVLPMYPHNANYHVYEKGCFKSLLNLLKQLKIGETLLLQNFNTLTQFNVSVLYIIANGCFEKIGFGLDGNIILSNHLDKSLIDLLDTVNCECDRVRNDQSRDVLNILPIEVTNDGDFFVNIVFYNNTFYRNKCSEYLYIIEQSL